MLVKAFSKSGSVSDFCFQQDDVEQGTKARHRKEMDMATLGRIIPNSLGINLRETRIQSGKKVLCINKQIFLKQSC